MWVRTSALRIVSLIFLILTVGIFIAGCVEEKVKEGKVEITPNRSISEVIQREEKSVKKSECENCHLNEKRVYVPQAYNVEGHKNSDFCISCHLRNFVGKLDKEGLLLKLHEKHVVYGDCRDCHKEIGVSEWECLNCHGKDPLSPGDNLVEIHKIRGVLCENCHGSNFIDIHINKTKFPFPLERITPKQ